eukprot:103598_1
MATKDTQEFNGNDIPEFEETDFILEFNDKLYIRHKDIHCSKPVNVQINWKQITKRAGLQWHQFAKDNLAYQIDTRRTMWCSENAIRWHTNTPQIQETSRYFKMQSILYTMHTRMIRL